MRIAVHALAALLPITLACGGGDSGGPSGPGLDGVWSGDNPPISLLVTLNQTGSQVSGSGTLTISGSSLPVSVSGTFNNPGISLTLTNACCVPAAYSGGLIHADTIGGVLNGSGFQAVGLTLTRN